MWVEALLKTVWFSAKRAAFFIFFHLHWAKISHINRQFLFDTVLEREGKEYKTSAGKRKSWISDFGKSAFMGLIFR